MSRRLALLSLHTHGDRSFIDDQRLALWSGVLREAGVENDIVLAVLDLRAGAADPALDLLTSSLADYDVVLFDRLFEHGLVTSLRAAHPSLRFLWAKSEHRLDVPPADFALEGDQDLTLPAAVSYIRGERASPPPGLRRLAGGLSVPLPPAEPVSALRPRYAPNLHPRVLTPDRLPARRTFSLMGNGGCPYQADARENPLYDGVELPAGTGRGCAFCTTGNDYVFRPAAEAAADVLAQLRYVRSEAPALDLLVLKDQNPFGYLTEFLAAVARERLGPFTLLVETRADWFLRSRPRFEQALASARVAGVTVAPYLVGIENFSQPELDRMNKGTTAALNEQFLDALREWKDTYGPALSLAHASFGFILFTPWTTLDDLRTNLASIRRTRFDEFRGSLLASRARLYPDTAMFHLARRDGLLVDRFDSVEHDGARRYGYEEAAPWRFQHPAVARLAELGASLSAARGHRDQPALLQALLDAFSSAIDPAQVGPEDVLARLGVLHAPVAAAGTSADPTTPPDLAPLLRPLAFGVPFEGGWTLGPPRASAGRVAIELKREGEAPFVVELVDAREKGYARSGRYSIRHASPVLTASQRRALDVLCRVIQSNDPATGAVRQVASPASSSGR